MRIFIEGTVNPTCLRVGVFLFGKPRFVRQVYPRKKRYKKTKLRSYLRRLLKQVVKVFSVERLRALVLFGLEDAAATALGTGTLYSIWGHFYALLQTYHPMKEVHFEVKPIYQKMFFSAKINCIGKLSLGKTIVVLFDFLKEAYRNERTSYMRTYDHSYAKY